MERIGWRHSSCLWFQMLGVEAHSFLPDEQGDGGHLARQSQTRHFRPDSLGQQRIVKLFERASLGSGHGGSTLEKILQFVIVIAIQPTNRSRSLRALQLSLDEALLGAAVRRVTGNLEKGMGNKAELLAIINFRGWTCRQ